MAETVFCNFYRAAGFKVYSSPSSDWCEVHKGMLLSIPFHRLIQPSEEELKELLDSSGAIGLRYATSSENFGFASSLMFCRNIGYGIGDVKQKARNRVYKGQNNCIVRQIDFTELAEKGLLLNIKTFQRQDRDDPKAQKAYWERLCDAGQKTAGAVAFGAYCGDKLAAYMVVLETDDVAEMIIQNSDTDLLHLCPNNALTYAVTEHYLTKSATPMPLCYGLGSLEQTDSLDHFKIGMGYQPEIIKQCLFFRSSVKWLICTNSLRIAEWMQQNLLKKNYFLRKTCGIVRCYLSQTVGVKTVTDDRYSLRPECETRGLD